MGLGHRVESGLGDGLAHPFIIDARAAECDVVADGCGKHVGALPHPGHAFAQRPDRVRGQGLAVDLDAPRCGNQQPGQQRHQDRLARAAAAHQGHVLAGAHRQRETLKHRFLIGKGEAKVREPYTGGWTLGGCRVHRCWFHRCRFYQCRFCRCWLYRVGGRLIRVGR